MAAAAASQATNSFFKQITVRMQGENRMVDVLPDWNVFLLKKYLAEMSGLKQEQLKIIFAGSVLPDKLTLQQCHLGQHSVVHVFVSVEKNDREISNGCQSPTVAVLGPTIEGLKENNSKRTNSKFYVYCKSICKSFRPGKLRVRCSNCKDNAFTLSRGPGSWSDVLERGRMKGQCNSSGCNCNKAEFFFKCAGHESLGDDRDVAMPLRHLTTNTRNVPCLACLDVLDTVLLFPCHDRHTICIPCFSDYCQTKIQDRQFVLVPDIGYTLPCPGTSGSCTTSFIEEVHHFRLAGNEKYDQYQRFATEDLILQSGGILCPGRGCGNGISTADDVRRIICKRSTGGCGLIFCRECLEDYHSGDCRRRNREQADTQQDYRVMSENARLARWEKEENLKTIRETTKLCPGCRSPTEKAGGCNHMTCQRCRFQWCWNCQVEWNNNCQGDHWFRSM